MIIFVKIMLVWLVAVKESLYHILHIFMFWLFLLSTDGMYASLSSYWITLHNLLSDRHNIIKGQESGAAKFCVHTRAIWY